MLENALFLTAAAAVIVVLAILWRSGRFLRCLLFSAVTGNLALTAVCYAGAFTGVMLTMNPFTVGTATIFGVPGVLMLMLLRIVLVI